MRRLLWISCAVVITLGAACEKTETPTTPTPPSNNVVYTVVGASDGIGYGGSVACFLFEDCPNGTGYPWLIKRRLQSEGRTVTLNNRAVPGAVLSPAVLALARELGRGITDVPGSFIEQIAPFVPSNTTHVTIFAGGNDANVIAQAIRAGRAGSDVRGFIDAYVQPWGNDLVELIRIIRARAPTARIVAMNLPNLGVAPYLASLTTQERSIMQRIAVSITDRINALTSQNVVVVDLMCEPRIYQAANFSADGYHPNDRGYALMAELAYPALVDGTAIPPSGSCAQRTALPPF